MSAPPGLGPTGEFPQGKLNADDEGELTIAVGIEADCVRIEFGKPTAWIAMDPEGALGLAASIAGKAMQLRRERGQ
jgi:hypothetical protein